MAHSNTRRWRTIGPSSFGLAFNLLALYISSWVYLVTNVLSVKAYLLQSILESPGALYGIGNSNAERNGIEDKLMHYYSIAQCAGTATLTLNVSATVTSIFSSVPIDASRSLQILFANTIICWRSALLWRRSIIIVWLIFGFMLSATFGASSSSSPSPSTPIFIHPCSSASVISRRGSRHAVGVLAVGDVRPGHRHSGHGQHVRGVPCGRRGCCADARDERPRHDAVRH